MPKYSINSETLEEIAQAIRVKKAATSSTYTQLEYLQSTGEQYIDTGYRVQSENLKIIARFAITEIKYWAAIWGVESSTVDDEGHRSLALTPLINGSSNLTFYSGISSQRGAIPINLNEIYSLTCQTNNGTITYNYNGITGTTSAEGSLCKTDNFYIFTLNSAASNGELSQASKMKLYSFEMYDNDILVRNYIPCIRTDGTLGLYDYVTKEFYTNVGNGSFIAGTEIKPIQDTNEPNNELMTPLEMPKQILTIGQSTQTALLQEKETNPSLETQEIIANDGYDGLSKVTVFAVPTEEWTFIMEDDSIVTKKVAVME